MTELTNITVTIAEARAVCNMLKRNQTLYVWGVTADSYNYIICDAEDEMPDVVTSPVTKTDVMYDG